MLSINEIKLGSVIAHGNEPYRVVYTQHVKMGRGGANLKTKLKNLITGQALEITYSGGDKIEEADMERSKANFLYREDETFNFMDNDSYEQFSLDKEAIGEPADFLKEGMTVDVLIFKQKPVSIKLPAKADLKIISSPPGIKGDTAGSATKMATLETGKQLKVPLFINEGDVIKVNTETGEYVERVN